MGKTAGSGDVNLGAIIKSTVPELFVRLTCVRLQKVLKLFTQIEASFQVLRNINLSQRWDTFHAVSGNYPVWFAINVYTHRNPSSLCLLWPHITVIRLSSPTPRFRVSRTLNEPLVRTDLPVQSHILLQ